MICFDFLSNINNVDIRYIAIITTNKNIIKTVICYNVLAFLLFSGSGRKVNKFVIYYNINWNLLIRGIVKDEDR